MTILWQGLKVTFGFFLIAGLLFASGVYTALLYAKVSGQDTVLIRKASPELYANATTAVQTVVPATVPANPIVEKPKSAMIDTPVIRQNPELPAGCEITSLTMLLQYTGVTKTKMELAAEMPKDETPVVLNTDGSIQFWGNPNTGFVGDITRKARGFGIYHAGLFPLLKQYNPQALDITNQPFEAYEQQIAKGIPVIVWTTIDYLVPVRWATWNTSSGPIQVTFAEHAVLLVGFDDKSVYLNDPLSGKKSVQVDKAQFIESWRAMGNQGLTYTKS
jgi:uncharacterized protein YvpB